MIKIEAKGEIGQGRQWRWFCQWHEWAGTWQIAKPVALSDGCEHAEAYHPDYVDTFYDENYSS